MTFDQDKLYVISRGSEESDMAYTTVAHGRHAQWILDCDGGQVLDREPTLDELIEYLDMEAENANHHDLVGIHGPLASLIKFCGGRARAILKAIALCGGLKYLRNWKPPV